MLSQQISVKSFQRLDRDMTARIDAPKSDQNGDVCAIIKVVTTQTGFVWEPDGLGIVSAERKAGEYWLYVPYGAKRLTIKHDKLGVLRDYFYPVPIEKATVYELVLTTGKVITTVDETIPTRFVIITSTPPMSDIYINDSHKGRTPYQAELPEGTYTYRLEKDMYISTAGRFVVDAGTSSDKVEISASLKPDFGFARIITKPDEGMDVLVDGILMRDKTPLTTDTLKPGKHLVTIQSPVYKAFTKEIEIVSGETRDYEFEMKSIYGSLSLESSPENGASVIIDGKNKGLVTPCKIEKITTGEHTITFRKEWYEPKTIKVNVRDGVTLSQKVELNKSYCEITLKTDNESELYIDNEFKGKGSWSGRLIAGFHSFEARKARHHAAIQKLEVAVGEEKTFTLAPVPIYGNLKIISNVIGANIYLDSVYKGTTPAILKNIFAGEYTLKIEKSGIGSLEKKIMIEEGKTLDLNEFIATSKMIRYASDPVGASVYLDNKLIGKTPLSKETDFGTYQLKMVYGKMQKEITVSIDAKGADNYEMDVNEIANVTISATFKGGKISVDKDSLKMMPFQKQLRLGTHQITLLKGADKMMKKINVEANESNKFIFTSRDLIKSFYNRNPLTFSYGYHQTNFLNETFAAYSSSAKLIQDYGHCAGVSMTLFPVEIEAKAFQSGFKAQGISVFVENAPIKHEGIEAAVKFMPVNLGTVMIPYIGVGYQLSRLHVTAANTTINKEASYNTSMPVGVAGLKIRISNVEVFGEYKYAYPISGGDYGNYQLSGGIGITL